MAAPHQQVVSANHTHAGLILRHACSDHRAAMNGMGNRYSRRYFLDVENGVMFEGGGAAKCARPSWISHRSAWRTAT